ncbi:pentatricopeptide repeat-containing protein At3g57430, chloroplastic-like [Phragmites australis]|uniref:pentatricopeptide repeat-containing protein At3g57430, chloroplastic-like n=1 Tax=Phragmites australis TaxID=29695 RepID=UPI002D77AAC5|nr:pentatricopeptide repeat-containing protein At3g57430, chloroplastic-like [Phragmites australis]
MVAHGVTFASALPACSQPEMLALGREMHAYVVKDTELAANSFVASVLVGMYASHERVDTARQVFVMVSVDRQLGLWNAMICGYAKAGMDEDALELFARMEAEDGIVPSETTMVGVLPACARSEAFAGKEAVHGYVLKRGMADNRFVQNALMDMYACLGDMDAARRIFAAIEPRDVVSWNTLITVCVVQGHIGEAFQLVREMQQQGRFTNATMEGDVTGVAGESAHPESAPVHEHMDTLLKQMRSHGYKPDTSRVLLMTSTTMRTRRSSGTTAAPRPLASLLLPTAQRPLASCLAPTHLPPPTNRPASAHLLSTTPHSPASHPSSPPARAHRLLTAST